MYLICDNCHQQYKTYKSPRCNHHFCSRKCAQEYKNTAVIKYCTQCCKEISVAKCQLKEHNFCSVLCHNLWQGRNKIEFTCKTCGKTFYRSPSWTKQKRGMYCSIECRNKDTEWIYNACIQGNLAQMNKRGLNKLETDGNKILDLLGLEYECQYLINNKICVDVFVPKYNLIIQWDGNYWHGKDTLYENLDKRQKNRVDRDKSQDAYFKACGYNELRFWESDVRQNPEVVYENIKRTIQQITE